MKSLYRRILRKDYTRGMIVRMRILAHTKKTRDFSVFNEMINERVLG